MNQSVCAAPAKQPTNERKMMAVRALAGAESVSVLAARHGVSRPLVYRQMYKASAALDDLFSTEQADDQNKVRFSLPITRRWLEQAALGLTMIARAWPPSHARWPCRTIWSAPRACCIASPTPRMPSDKAGVGCMPPWVASSTRSMRRSHRPCATPHAAARWLKTSTHGCATA